MSAAEAFPAAGPAPRVDPRTVLVLVALAQFMVVLDATVVNVALPTIQHAVGFSEQSLCFGGRMPSPRELLAADPREVRASGMSNRKSATLRALAERFEDGRLSDESLARLSDEEVEASLTEIPGIGPWTAHGFLIVALDRPDVLLSGDVALRRAVRIAYGFDHLPSEDEMVRLAERWRPYRSLAVGYLFASEFEKGT
jgi:3-methyladenine DNA glycosylase/8-oxoguanine DNA glycosylase